MAAATLFDETSPAPGERAQRKMASIRVVHSIQTVPTSDTGLVVLGIDGWKVVQRLDTLGLDFDVGMRVVFCEIDSFVPSSLVALEPVTEFLGVRGTRLRSRKIHKILSQGLALPLAESMRDLPTGTDVSEMLGIRKWQNETELRAADLEFPVHLIPKTDQERVQNLVDVIFPDPDANCASSTGCASSEWEYEVTLKLDGSSTTCYHHDGHFGVCTRNREVTPTSKEGASRWRACESQGLLDALRALAPRNLALQGELVGPKVQNNPMALDSCCIYIFDVYDIDAGRYLLPAERTALLERAGVKQAPVVETVNVRERFKSLDEILEYANTASLLPESLAPKRAGTQGEGVVFKRMRSTLLPVSPPSFKAISNLYITKFPSRA